MGSQLPPRRITAGEFIPTVAQTGSEEDNTAFRISNMLLRGPEEGRRYWESFSGLGDLGQLVPMSEMTGTLALTQNSNLVTGTGTLFLTECPYIGMRISCIPASNSANHFIVVKNVISNTQMTVWTPPHGNPPWPTISGLTGWRMPRAYAVNNQLGVSTWGDVLKLDRGSFLGAGLGTFFLDGQELGGTTLTLSRQPTIALYDPVTNTYTVFPLGMDTSAPPTLAAVGGGAKMQGGNYSFVITPARKETGGYNNPSERADVTIATNDMIACTFPAMDTANGQDAWIVWVTTFTDTLGADLNYLNGPWHRLRMVDDDEVSSGGGTVSFEYYDAEVENNILVSFNNDAPTDAMGVESMNTNIIWTSVQGQGFTTNPAATSPGPFLSPAKPNNIEAAPLELAISSSPPETIIGTIPGAQGRIYAETVNHLQIVQSTPSDLVPFVIRPLWHTGFATWEQVIFVDGVLYGIPVSGPVRSAGEGDESYVQHDWGAKVYSITRNWNPGQSLIAYDPKNDAAILFHIADELNDAGFWTTKWMAYGIALQRWIGAGVFTNDTKDQIVCGVATVGDKLEILISGRGEVTPSLPVAALDLEADAGLGLADLAAVALWTDVISGETAVQATGANQPQFRATDGPGSRPCVRFDGTTDFLELSDFTSQNYTIFAVLKPANSSLHSIVCGVAGSLQYRTDGSLRQATTVCNTANLGTSDTALSTSAFQQINVTWDGSASIFRLGGVSDGLDLTPASLTNPINRIGIQGVALNEFFQGDICMIRIYTEALTIDQVESVEAEILARWGV